ncbi:hypothetical protein [Alicyclobacillus fastidiosus]|uniref:Uncharacterized protein n=1 Tax=Alicyclobacillus fastidiosus TaxID=392011 RepID=A0ABV5AIB9_9BACL|nr:hypothetical protein [Alicyclobacillus fastidiosus]WEH11112.1 hypothetical protein PYS47_07810 [Alicyclobacillus fastidiosus]
MKPQQRSSKCAIVNKTVSFNVEDPYQAELLKRTQQFPNFSAAVKRWLAGESVVSIPMVQLQSEAASVAQAVVQPQEIEFDPVSALF